MTPYPTELPTSTPTLPPTTGPTPLPTETPRVAVEFTVSVARYDLTGAANDTAVATALIEAVVAEIEAAVVNGTFETAFSRVGNASGLALAALAVDTADSLAELSTMQNTTHLDLFQFRYTEVPTTVPTALPTTSSPTSAPTALPTITSMPSPVPTALPSPAPTTPVPSPVPTAGPSAVPTAGPTLVPTAVPSLLPSSAPSPLPSAGPTPGPSPVPTTPVPSPLPSPDPTSQPTFAPYMLLEATGAVVFGGFDSVASFGPGHEHAFVDTLIDVSQFVDEAEEVCCLEESMYQPKDGARRRLGGNGGARFTLFQKSTGFVRVNFTLQLNLDEFAMEYAEWPTPTPTTSVPTMTPVPTTSGPTPLPTGAPTYGPTPVPTMLPTYGPTYGPSQLPTAVPTYAPSAVPTYSPSAVPS